MNIRDGQQSQEPDVLTSAVRVSLSRSIVHRLVGSTEEIPVVTLDPGLEQLLRKNFQTTEEGIGCEPGLADQLQKALFEASGKQEAVGQPSILLVAAGLRPWMARFARHAALGITVLSHNEVPTGRRVNVVAVVDGNPSN